MRRILSIGALAFTAWLAAGCSGREFAEVEGTVTLDQKPLSQAQVVFVPDIAKGNTGNNAYAYTDDNGHYHLRADRDDRSGTVLGPHRVYFVDLTTVPNLLNLPALPGEQARPAGPGAKLRFRRIYADLLETPFKDIDVKSGHQSIDFELKSGK